MRYTFVFIVLIFFTGCSKMGYLTLDSYEPTSTKLSNETSIQKAYIKSIIDVRADEQKIGLINKSHILRTDTNLRIWLYKALEKGLTAKGYKIIEEPLREALSIKVAIIGFNIDFNEAITKHSNLNAFIDIQLSLTKGFKQKRENILLRHNNYYKNTPSRGEFEDIMQILMNDMATQIISKGTAL